MFGNIEYVSSESETELIQVKGQAHQPNIIGNKSSQSDQEVSDGELSEKIIVSDVEIEEDANHEKQEFDNIVKLFSRDLQQHMKKKHLTGRQKKVPRHLQQKIGEATNLYTFGRFDEAIPIFESVIKEMPDLADVTHTMSLIYEEKGDLDKAFTFCFLSAIETRTDSEKWQQCARLALGIQNSSHAIYCFNRAIKSLDPISQFKAVFDLKM